MVDKLTWMFQESKEKEKTEDRKDSKEKENGE